MKKLFGTFRDLHLVTKIIIVIVLLQIGIVAAMGLGPSIFPAASTSSASDSGYTVEYKVTGTVKKATVTYTNEKGWTSQKVVNVPWSWQSESKAHDGTLIYLSAKGDGLGSLKAQIKLNGKVWKEDEDFGPFIAVGANGYAGDE